MGSAKFSHSGRYSRDSRAVARIERRDEKRVARPIVSRSLRSDPIHVRVRVSKRRDYRVGVENKRIDGRRTGSDFRVTIFTFYHAI